MVEPRVHAVHTVHIFFTLPEPLDLPSGFAIQRLEQPGTYIGESFRAWDGSTLSTDDLSAGPLCRFTRMTTSADISATSRSADLARATWPTLPPAPRDQSAQGPVEDPSPNSVPDRLVTGVEIVRAFSCEEPTCTGQPDDDVFEAVFAEGIRLVRALQQSVYVISRQPYTLVAQASIPFLTPVGLGEVRDDEFMPPSRMTFWMANQNLLAQLPPYDLTDENLGAIAGLLGHIAQRTFFGYLDFQREAAVAYRTRGDNRSAAIFTGLACERLLDDLLAHLLFEDGVKPEEAPATFFDQQGITQRVRREFHPRLKGDWDTSQPGPVGNWWHHVAKLRNRVVHGAYTPTDDEIELATSAATALVTYIGDCLIERLTGEGKYRLTALALLGESGMRRRNAWTRRSRDAAKRFEEEDLWSLAARWKAAAERQRAIQFGDTIQPDPSSAHVMYIAPSGSPSYWVQHARDVCQARLIAEPTGLSSGQRSAMAALAQAASEVTEPGDWPLVAAVEVAPTQEMTALGEWVEEYHLIPGAEVMIDGSDRTIPSV